MGRLRRQADGCEARLVQETRVGRAPLSELRIADSTVSSQHALLRYTPEGWTVRDLASTNGTWVDGQRLATGAACSLSRGAAVAFGRIEESWEVVDDGPPTAAVMVVGDPRAIVEANDGLLALPEEDNPEAVVLRAPDGTWNLESSSHHGPLADGDTFQIAGKTYLFSDGGSGGLETERVGDRPIRWRVADSRIRFMVSRDEEEVALQVQHGAHSVQVSNRSHFYLLLLLARSRIKDELEENLPPPVAGWRYAEDLCDALKVSRINVNVLVHRLRRDFASLGFVDPASVVQRRPRLGELRIGLGSEHIEVVPMG